MHLPDVIGHQNDDSGKWPDFWIEDASRCIPGKGVQLHPDVVQAEHLAQYRVDMRSLWQIDYLGGGGSGTVKLMMNLRQKLFAVKTYPCDWRSWKSFPREFEAMCLLDHPCVVPCYGWSTVSHGSTGTSAVLIMKYMSGGSLRRVLEKVKAGEAPEFWNPTGIAIIVCAIASGLEFIHSEHLIH
jgi:serine/threonine protein kinase